MIKFVETGCVKMKYLILIFSFFTLVSCKDKKDDKLALNENEQIEVYDFAGLEPLLSAQDNTVYIINFWATWCAPCVKELPFFEKINTEYRNKNVEVILVSLDFPHLYESKLKPFIVEHDIKSKVIALDDVDMNTWIPIVNPDWSGSIPATLIYKNDKSKF